MDELPRSNLGRPELVRPALPASPIERVRDWFEWFGPGRLLLIAVSVALIGAGGYWLVAPPPPAVEASLPMTPGAATTSVGPDGPSGTASGAPVDQTIAAGPVGGGTDVSGDAVTGATDAAPVDIVVHVAGAVVAPGVHRLPASARVADAIAAAGGPSPEAHTDAINLAAPLADGDRVYVPTRDDGVEVPAGVTNAAPAVAETAGGVTAVGPVAINTATVDQLDALPGVGPATAQAIVAHREQHGPFTSIDGLSDVRGIGPAKLDAIRPMVTL